MKPPFYCFITDGTLSPKMGSKFKHLVMSLANNSAKSSVTKTTMEDASFFNSSLKKTDTNYEQKTLGRGSVNIVSKLNILNPFSVSRQVVGHQMVQFFLSFIRTMTIMSFVSYPFVSFSYNSMQKNTVQ